VVNSKNPKKAKNKKTNKKSLPSLVHNEISLLKAFFTLYK